VNPGPDFKQLLRGEIGAEEYVRRVREKRTARLEPYRPSQCGLRSGEPDHSLPDSNGCKRLCELCDEPLRPDDDRAHPWCVEQLEDRQRWEDVR